METEIPIENKVEKTVPNDLILKRQKLEQAIENTKLMIELAKLQSEALKKQYEVMMKYPKPLEPKFEYEQQPEWEEVARMFHEIGLKQKLKEIELTIKGYEDQIEVFRKQLEEENGSEEEKNREEGE